MAKYSDLDPSGSGAIPPWVSGMTVEQYAVVLSPAAALKPYIRTAATGDGTTDPALDSANYRAFGERPPKAVFGNDSLTGADFPSAGTSTWRVAGNLRQILSGALVANTYKTVLSVSGGGVLNFAALTTLDPTARGCALRLFLDGSQVYEGAVASLPTGKCIVGVGAIDITTTSGPPLFQPLRFHASLKVDLRSTLTETDKVSLLTNYMTD